jgi:hypothetical protein
MEHGALHQKHQLNTRAGAAWDRPWRRLVRIVHISRKGKLDLQHPEGEIMKGWHTDKVRPYNLRI